MRTEAWAQWRSSRKGGAVVRRETATLSGVKSYSWMPGDVVVIGDGREKHTVVVTGVNSDTVVEIKRPPWYSRLFWYVVVRVSVWWHCR